MRFAFIQAKTAEHPVPVLCRVLRVTRPGFYAWCKRPESSRSKADRRLAVLARAAHKESRQCCGSPRLVRVLRVAHGERVGRRRMRRLMVQEGLVARVRRRYKCTTMSDHDQPVASNLLDRQNSDQGSTYASDDYQRLLRAHGITCSMSRRGNCIDNAAMESWFSTLKCELGERFESYRRAKEELFDYIETFYNRRRRHSSLDHLSPVEFEQRGRETPVFDVAA